jgi:hypothetical protein
MPDLRWLSQTLCAIGFESALRNFKGFSRN